MASENAPQLKQQAHELIDNLPESATWDDVAYEADLCLIERGLADSQAGRILTVDDLMKEFGVQLPASSPPRTLKRSRHSGFPRRSKADDFQDIQKAESNNR